jgi:hypothetical protein
VSAKGSATTLERVFVDERGRVARGRAAWLWSLLPRLPCSGARRRSAELRGSPQRRPAFLERANAAGGMPKFVTDEVQANPRRLGCVL